MKIAGVELKDLQSEILTILVDFDRVCRNNNINYSLFAGTMLGAVRHQGFIPWDDDIDVVLTRENYKKFILVSDQLSPGFTLDMNSYHRYSKIRKDGTLFREPITQNLNDVHQGIFIDVFQLDNVSPSTARGIFQKICYMIIFNLTRSRPKETYLSEKNMIKKGIKYSLYLINKIIPIRLLNSIMTKLELMFFGKTDCYTCITSGISDHYYENYMIEKKDLQFDSIKFENHEFMIFRDYDKYLTKNYGDYMQLPPVEERQPHHGVLEIVL